MSVFTAIHADMVVPTVPRLRAACPIPGHTTMALVMPLYSLTAADAALAMAPGSSGPRTTLATNLGICCLASLHAIHCAGYGHGDIKPANIMLDHSGVVSLIDLGTAQRLGDPFHESSAYSLGEPAVCSLDYDLVCLSSTLAFMEHAITPGALTRAEMHAQLARVGPPSPSPVTRLALQCLGGHAAAGPLSLLLELAQALASASQGLPGVLSPASVWPRAR
jgi:hypothetical protein